MTDMDAFFHKHYPDIYRLAVSFLKNSEDAADMMQDTYMIVQKEQMKKNILDMENPRAWLFRIVTNLCLNHVKKKWRIRDLLVRNAEQMIRRERYSNHYKSAEESVIFEDEQGKLNQLISQLSPKNRILLELFQRGLKYEEIAVALNIKKECVGNKLYRVRTRLSNALKSQGGLS
jgi:RNA polymerase sigma-70 factor (ECF subfamily)